MTRFDPIDPERMTPEQRAVADTIASGPRGGVRGPFLALLHQPALAEHLQRLGEHLRFGTGLPATLVELAVLMTARRWDCQFEWVAHARLARAAGLDPAIADAIAEGRVPPSMSDDERIVHAFCAQALERAEVGDDAFAPVRARFGQAGALDLLALCGYYGLLAMVLNTARIPLPDGVAPPLRPLAPPRPPSAAPDTPAPGAPR